MLVFAELSGGHSVPIGNSVPFSSRPGTQSPSVPARELSSKVWSASEIFGLPRVRRVTPWLKIRSNRTRTLFRQTIWSPSFPISGRICWSLSLNACFNCVAIDLLWLPRTYLQSRHVNQTCRHASFYDVRPVAQAGLGSYANPQVPSGLSRKW